MNISKRRWTLAGILILAGAAPGSTWAANTKFLNVQGKLTDTSGNPLTGNQVVTFRLYTSSTVAVSSAVWSENQTVVLSTGLFNVTLGTSTALDSLAFNQSYYLGIQVAGDANELSPRQQLGASAYAQGSLGSFNVGSNLDVNSTATVRGNAFSVGGSTLTVWNGDVLVGNLQGPGIPPQAKLQVSQGLGTSNTAPTSINLANVYLQLGGAEYNNGSYRVIGFGQVGQGINYPAAYQGYLETNDAAQGLGALVFGTRNTGSDALPSERMRIDPVGNVGIGTTSPGAVLHVAQNATGDQRLLQIGEPGFPTTHGITLHGNNFDGVFKWFGLNASVETAKPMLSMNRGNGYIGISTGIPQGLFDIGGGTLTVQPSGNVGIGKTNPASTLDVNGTATAAGLVVNGNTNYSGSTNAYTSSGTIYTGGWPIAYNVVVASFDASYVGGVGASTMTVPVSSATYELQFDLAVVAATQFRLRFNGDTGNGYYSNEIWNDVTATVNGGGGNGVDGCFIVRSGLVLSANGLLTGKYRISIWGNMASVSGHSDAMYVPNDSYQEMSACYYPGSSPITSVSIVAITGGGAFGGHTELRRIR